MVRGRSCTTGWTLLLSLLVAIPVARAQEGEGRLDRELDDALRKAHEPPVDDRPAPVERRAEPPAERPPAPEGGAHAFPSAEKPGPHGALRVGIWPAWLSGVRVGSKKLGIEGGDFPLTVAGGSNHAAPCYFARGGLSLGPLTLEATYRGGSWGGQEGADRTITFGAATFPLGTPLQTRFDMRLIDLDARLDFIRVEGITAGGSFGFRYAYALTQFRAGAAGRAAQSNEGFMPMFGFAVNAKIPVTDGLSFEVFTRNRIGGWSYGHKEVHDHGGPSTFLGIPTGGGGPHVRWTHFERYNSYSTESEAGVNVVLFSVVAIGAGYRMDLVQLDFESNGDRKRTYWLQHGPFVSASIVF